MCDKRLKKNIFFYIKRSIKFLGYSDYAIGRRLMTTTNDINENPRGAQVIGTLQTIIIDIHRR